MIRCGQAEPSPSRISTRAREPRSFGTRQNAVRLSWPQFAWVGREAVGEDPLVGVDRRPEERLQAGRVLDHARDEAARRAGSSPSGPPSSANALRAVLAVEREMHVEAGAALVGKWAAHEGREQPLARGDLLHRGLEHERAVGGVERLRVLDVDLVLRVHELVVRGERLQAEVVAPEQHLEHDPARIGDGADRVDAGELVDVAAQAVRPPPGRARRGRTRARARRSASGRARRSRRRPGAAAPAGMTASARSRRASRPRRGTRPPPAATARRAACRGRA